MAILTSKAFPSDHLYYLLISIFIVVLLLRNDQIDHTKSLVCT